MANTYIISKVWETSNKELIINKSLRKAMGVIIFVILTTIGAFVRIPLPFTPVPITLQVFFVLLAGAVLGRKMGTLSQLSYYLIGGLGLPIFTGASGGFAHLAGPTGGYLIGFIIAAYLIGGLVKTEGHYPKLRLFLSMLFGVGIIYSLGVIQLSFVLHISLKKAFLLGALPFILGDLLKAAAAILVYNKFQNRFKALFSD